MTIEQARETDLAHDDARVAKAEAEAAEAEQAAATLANSAIEGGKGSAAPSAAIEQRAVAEFTRERAVRLRERADQAREAKRLLDLDQVGQDANALAAAASKSDAAVKAAVSKIAEAREELLQACEDHNRQVDVLRNRINALGGEPQPNNGRLLATSAYVHVAHGSSVRTRAAAVHRVDMTRMLLAATQAASGTVGGESGARVALSTIGRLAETYTVPGDQA